MIHLKQKLRLNSGKPLEQAIKRLLAETSCSSARPVVRHLKSVLTRSVIRQYCTAKMADKKRKHETLTLTKKMEILRKLDNGENQVKLVNMV